ncbi:MAG TPA: hypothetical protein VMU94_24625 [Streptosporangiaceae bacterium]|nr:hypothetical protein [Streptosporangiaceae bacterium]
MTALYCACCTTFIAMVPEGTPASVCMPCYFDEEFGRPCNGPYRYVEYEHEDSSFEVVVAELPS